MKHHLYHLSITQEICGITLALAEVLYTRGESILHKGAVCSMDPLQIMSIGSRMVKTESIGEKNQSHAL